MFLFLSLSCPSMFRTLIVLDTTSQSSVGEVVSYQLFLREPKEEYPDLGESYCGPDIPTNTFMLVG